MNFTVWAPNAGKVDLILDDQSFPMSRSENGWWVHEMDAVDGMRYRFSLDGGSPMPDPRSKWQPDGVHAASCVLDTSKLRNRNAAPFQQVPLRDAILYELHIGTFTPEGTYLSAIRKLPHLVSLGITHIEIMPVATFPGQRGWGYDGVDLFAPHPVYGTPQELVAFIHACHDAGIGVLLDVVYNHLGPDGNYLSAFGPYFTNHVSTPWGAALNFDQAGSDEVRSFVIDNALMWLRDYGFDGLRLDAVHAIYDSRARHLLEELSQRVRGLEETENRPLVLIAESDLNDPRMVRPTEIGGYGLDAHWADELHHTIHVFLTGENNGYYSDFGGLEDLATTLAEGYLFQGHYSPSRQRSHGRPPVGLHPEQLVVCAQNHDQIGNRAYGERLSHLLPPEKLKVAAALVLLSPCLPLLFQGEEWGATSPFLFFSDHESEELRRIIRESRHEEFKAFSWKEDVPDPSEETSFQKSQLNWQELGDSKHQELFEWHQALINIRKGNQNRPEILPGAKVSWDADQLWMTLLCGDVLAAFNFAEQSQQVPLPEGAWKLALSSFDDASSQKKEIPSFGVLVFTRQAI